MYKFVFTNGRVVTTNDTTLPKRLKLKVKLVFVRSAVTGNFVKIAGE